MAKPKVNVINLFRFGRKIYCVSCGVNTYPVNSDKKLIQFSHEASVFEPCSCNVIDKLSYTFRIESRRRSPANSRDVVSNLKGGGLIS